MVSLCTGYCQKQEQVFTTALTEATNYQLTEAELTIFTPSGNLVFIASS
jgi:hypothetical protein